MKKPKTISYYLHTLNGLPAAFDGRQVHYMTHGDRLAASLDQIRAEQRASAEWRAKKGYDMNCKYDYRRLRLPKGRES